MFQHHRTQSLHWVFFTSCDRGDSGESCEGAYKRLWHTQNGEMYCVSFESYFNKNTHSKSLLGSFLHFNLPVDCNSFSLNIFSTSFFFFMLYVYSLQMNGSYQRAKNLTGKSWRSCVQNSWLFYLSRLQEAAFNSIFPSTSEEWRRLWFIIVSTI